MHCDVLLTFHAQLIAALAQYDAFVTGAKLAYTHLLAIMGILLMIGRFCLAWVRGVTGGAAGELLHLWDGVLVY